ncbi:MAG TPA: hypothetical protein VLL52_18120 [Anaerolineae bacterium]|nr:hypothetical protein [Anaerolineae bacterium]
MNKTFTYTARSVEDPHKMATFTLQNGHVDVKLGTAILEQAEKAISAFQNKTDERLTAWIEPAATGTLQKVMQPINLSDFDAQMKGDTLQTTAWLRAGGLRLAPIIVSWSDVDNPAGARAFVQEIDTRKEESQRSTTIPDPLDYWATWAIVSFMSLVVPLFWWHKWQQRHA